MSDAVSHGDRELLLSFETTCLSDWCPTERGRRMKRKMEGEKGGDEGRRDREQEIERKRK